MTYRAAVAGCTGYAGGELLRLLLNHPEIEIGALSAASSAGSKLGEHHRNLAPLAARQVVATTPAELADHDIIFLALPHGASAEVVGQLPDDVLVLDCGADFRLADAAAWREYYGTDHAGTWPYGLPELPGQRDVLAGARRIAVPGCYPTNVTLTLMPAIVSGAISGADVTVAAASGVSGAGKGLKPHLLGGEILDSMSVYGVGGGHRHVPEIIQNLRLLGAAEPSISFTPMLAPMARGIISVCTAPCDRPAAEIQAIYEDFYADEPFVVVEPEGTWPTTKSVRGSNAVRIQVTVDERARRLVAVGVIDNLTKGTAGGAVQSMNLALGLPETTGLDTIGVAP